MISVEKVKGVGSRTSMLLKKLNINTVDDLVTHYPYRYEFIKRSNLKEKCEDDKVIIKDIEEFNNKDIGYDIGNKTLRNFYKDLSGAKRVIINGPMGMFEDNRFTNGTNKLLKYLNEDEKIVILLYYGEQYKIREIAEILSESEGTIKNRISRAKAKIKIHIKEEKNYG